MIGERLRIGRDEPRTLWGLVDLLRIPAFLLDQNKIVLYANDAADALCRADAGLTVSRDRIVCANHGANSALQKAIEAACCMGLQARPDSRAEVVVPRFGGTLSPLVVELVPLRSAYVHGSRLPRCLALINEPDRPLPARLQLLQAAWQLTAAEARLAWALANGETIADYAARSAIAASTARWHLKNTQSKTGTHSLEALVALVRATILRV